MLDLVPRSFRSPLASLHRRRFLAALGIAPVGLSGLLTGCGAGDDDPPSDTAGMSAQDAAKAAVARGIVGALSQYIDGKASQPPQRGTAGVRRLGQASSVQASDPFAIGSTTKAMTAALAARLVDSGHLRWESTLEQMLPTLAADMRPAYRSVTLRQLLAHRSGLMAFQSGADVDALENSFGEDIPDDVAAQRQLFARWVLSQAPINGIRPGVDYAYSNGGYTVVGAILEAHTGQRYEDLFTTQLARPLGMQHPWRDPFTGDSLPVVGHFGSPGKLSVHQPSDPLADILTRLMAPAGSSLHLSAADYGLWLQWHMRAMAGQPTPLPASYLGALRAAQDEEYLMGWIARKRVATPMLVHDGSTLGFQSLAWVDLDGQGGGHLWANCAEGGGSPWVSTALIELMEGMRRHYRR